MSESEYKAKVLEFVLFCVEMYAQRGGVSGSVVMKRFDESGVLDFLRNNYVSSASLATDSLSRSSPDGSRDVSASGLFQFAVS